MNKFMSTSVRLSRKNMDYIRGEPCYHLATKKSSYYSIIH